MELLRGRGLKVLFGRGERGQKGIGVVVSCNTRNSRRVPIYQNNIAVKAIKLFWRRDRH
jgi:hypothetical protein